jgi:hypothetical protein
VTRDPFEDRLKLHSVYRDARSNRNSYFEKLAILDGGTVALVVSAVLGLHGSIGHKVFLVGGVAFLMVALLALLSRNLIGSEMEFHVAARTVNDPVIHEHAVVTREKWLNRWFGRLELVGVGLTIMGMLLLGLEACLTLYAHP